MGTCGEIYKAAELLEALEKAGNGQSSSVSGNSKEFEPSIL